MHWLAPPPEAAPGDLVARPPTRRTTAADTARPSTPSPHTSSHGKPTRPHQRPAGFGLYLTTLCPGRPCTPLAVPGSSGHCHRDRPRSPQSIPAEVLGNTPNPAPRHRAPDAWLAISPGRAGCSRPCALQIRVAAARTPSVRPRRHQYSGPPPVATPPPDRSRESPALG